MYAHILMIPSNYESIETGEWRALYVNIILCWMEYYFSSAYNPENTFLLPTYILSPETKHKIRIRYISNKPGPTGLQIRQLFILMPESAILFFRFYVSAGIFRMFITNAKNFRKKDIICIYPSALTWIQWDPKTLLDTIRRDHFSLAWLQLKAR